ncbi:kielin/chordin-like protein isoform X1 [Toxorhynchites rutilus septentrionalis]|uniref:kielin/chordin-like protein isoform X1 n=1 Tax=Toxorhynchites rutilus septentrionalis TaxID=329112 RepID=UPI002479672B|nr:kielin/chordin-like protein isoform X1 [Toxorhynchites rutilus septentrionalis]XP_055619071.1 kielin/chordin-like protein isoform X1 [Toxorhynchites rutilus septentrionalis]XP_055619072.1 kielin/chordin-like protein isoform X1 [Toxorhynchites rutilus septentrionalis]XP_055619074.1 kielin/chordin-like protein isoform X1 [Toxorhynchites rutilus septentrionalis]
MRSTVEMRLIIVFMILVVVPYVIPTDNVGCRNVACPISEPCPSDSYPKLTTRHHPLVHNPHHLRSGTGEIVRRERAIAYGARRRESIKIIPGAYDHHNNKRSIVDDAMLIQHCCPHYECACKPDYCDQECPPDKIPVNITDPTENNALKYGVPGKCCIPCTNSYCMHHTFRRHGEKWRGDDCTTCECQYGETKCQQSYCNPPDCLSYKQIPGECCPVCDNDATNFCNDVQNCNIHCKYGYQKRGNCDLCECIRTIHNRTLTGNEASSYPINNVTLKDYEISEDNTHDNAHRNPIQQHTHGRDDNYVYSIQFWVLILLSLVAVLTVILLTIWCCHFHRSTKYSTVQIA